MSLTNDVPVTTVNKDSTQEAHENLEDEEWPTGPPIRRGFINEDEDSIGDEPPPLRERKDDNVLKCTVQSAL